MQSYVASHQNRSTLGTALSMSTGIRIGELCTLQWKDIDLEKCILTVRKTMHELLGHSSVEITLNRYVHSSFEQKREYMKRLDLAF